MSAILRIKVGGNWVDVPAVKGTSAYESAVAAGYTGTELEFQTLLYNNLELAGTVAGHTTQLADVVPKTNNRNWLYEGRDLKALFGTALAFRTAVAAGNFDNIRIGDYWPISLSGTYKDYASNTTKTLSGAIVNLEVAGINLYYNYGDTALAVPHILFCPRDCLPQTGAMRTTDAGWYSEATTNPWLGSHMYQTLNAADGLLPLIAATDIGAYIYGGPNGAGMRTLLPTMASGVSAPTSWSWFDRGKLFLPMEREVWGSTIWADNAFSQGLPVQWPIFIGTLRHIVKGLGNAGSRIYWWCATATNATYFAFVDNIGFPSIIGASFAFGVAPCFLIS